MNKHGRQNEKYFTHHIIQIYKMRQTRNTPIQIPFYTFCISQNVSIKVNLSEKESISLAANTKNKLRSILRQNQMLNETNKKTLKINHLTKIYGLIVAHAKTIQKKTENHSFSKNQRTKIKRLPFSRLKVRQNNHRKETNGVRQFSKKNSVEIKFCISEIAMRHRMMNGQKSVLTYKCE